MKTYISTFSYKGQDIDVLYVKGNMSYVFEKWGERFGGAVKVEGKSIRDIMNATACLLIQFIETYDAVEKKSKK